MTIQNDHIASRDTVIRRRDNVFSKKNIFTPFGGENLRYIDYLSFRYQYRTTCDYSKCYFLFPFKIKALQSVLLYKVQINSTFAVNE